MGITWTLAQLCESIHLAVWPLKSVISLEEKGMEYSVDGEKKHLICSQ